MSIPLFVIDGGSSQIDTVVEAIAPTTEVEVVGRAGAIADVEPAHADPKPEWILIDARAVLGATRDHLVQLTGVFPESSIFVVAEMHQDTPASAGRDVLPSEEGNEAFAAIRDAGAAGVLIPREFVPTLVPRLSNLMRREDPAVSGDSPFTRREREVLGLLARGEYVRSIARTLGLSVHTVRGHVKNILAKLGCHSQLEAVAKAKALGWLSD